MFFQQALINMGIFDRKSITKTIKTTEGFYFGKSESEGESSYKNRAILFSMTIWIFCLKSETDVLSLQDEKDLENPLLPNT